MCAKYAKKKPRKKQGIWIALAIAAVLIVAAVLAASGGNPLGQAKTGEVDDGIIMSIHEQGEKTIVTTQYGKIMYPFSFSDLIHVVPKRTETCELLEFYGKLEHGEYLLYTLWLGKEQGTYVGIVKDRAGEPVDVYLEMAPTPSDLQGWDENSFFAAQETVNEVLSSFIPDYQME